MAGIRGKGQGVADPGTDDLDQHETRNQREGAGQHALVIVLVGVAVDGTLRDRGNGRSIALVPLGQMPVLFLRIRPRAP